MGTWGETSLYKPLLGDPQEDYVVLKYESKLRTDKLFRITSLSGDFKKMPSHRRINVVQTKTKRKSGATGITRNT